MTPSAAPNPEDPRSLKRTRGGRERLLSAAAELFHAHTLAGTSLQMIADRLGVTKAALYHHFGSRDEIVIALMTPVLDDVEQALAEVSELDAAPRHERTRQFYSDFVIRHRSTINLFFFDRVALPGDLPVRVDSLVDAVAQAMADGPSREQVVRQVALVYGAAALATRDDLSDDDLRRTLPLVLGQH